MSSMPDTLLVSGFAFDEIALSESAKVPDDFSRFSELRNVRRVSNCYFPLRTFFSGLLKRVGLLL
jgi:hypothetical protein